jgi:CxxC-x17-CxxC domain-containing protein
MSKNETVFFGLTNFRNQKTKFGIKTDDRRRHFYCIGKTGMGKSNLMENMAIQDIQAGRGIAYVDPHGEGAEKLLDFVPANRINDVIFFNPADLDYPIAFNVMEKVDFRYRHLIAGGLMGVFKKVWPDVWSARMEYILNNTILALLEYPDSTLLGVNRMLADVEYREKVVAKVTDPIVKSFWTTEFARYTQRYEIEATAAIQNKVGQFISNPLIRNLIGQVKSTIDMREIMDTEKIFIMDLSKGRIGEDNSRLLGALLITKLQLAAMSRVDIAENDRKDFYLYVDEFQNFATESFANILSEARKYRLNIILGHQYITQMEEEIRDAVFGNVGTLIVFRVGAEDAEFLEKEFTPQFTAEDLVNLPKYNVYLKLMIDGVAGHPFSAETLPPPIPLDPNNRDKIIRASRERYGVKKETVEDKIFRWSGFAENQEKEKTLVKGEAKEQHRQVQNKNNLENMPHGEIKLYDAICSNCKKPTKVVFPPEEGRAVYCKSCLKKIKPTQDGKTVKQENTLFGEEIKLGNISFHNPKRNLEDQKQNKPKRREVNLSDLKKALDESLSQKDESNDQEGEENKKIMKPGEKIKL